MSDDRRGPDMDAVPFHRPEPEDAAGRPAAPALLDARGVGFSVGRGADVLRILHDARLTARGHEFVGVLGPNGSGKTTFLKRIAGLLPGEGEIRLDGRDARDLTVRERSRLVAFLHQDTQVPFSFTGREIVSMGRHPFANGLSAAEGEADRKAVQRAVQDAGCDEFADKPVTALSAGERQRVMLARVLAQDTPILLLDEPTANLDVLHAEETFELLRRLASRGRCVVAVLHDLRAAAKHCTRVSLMHHGTIVADGDPEDVLHEGHVAYVYGVAARTFRNPAGEWDYYLP